MVQQEFSENELNIIFQSLNFITIQGKDARNVADLLDKVSGGLNYIKELKHVVNCFIIKPIICK